MSLLFSYPILVFLLIIPLYNLYLLIFNFRIVKFAWTQNGRWVPNIPLFGNMYVTYFGKFDLLSGLILAKKLFGLPIGVWFGRQFFYASDNPEEAKIVFDNPKCLDKAEIYEDIKIFFGESLGTVNVTSSGLTEEEVGEDIEAIGPIVTSAQKEFLRVFLNPLISAKLWLRLPTSAKMRNLLSEFRSVINKVIIQKKEDKINNLDVQDPKDVCLIDLLLSDAFKNQPKADIYEELLLFSLAVSTLKYSQNIVSKTTDTTGNTLAVCFTLLGMHLEVQRKLYEEIEEVFGDCDVYGPKLADLKYLEMVINETLRLFPSVPLLARYCTEDVDLGDKILPKGVNFNASVYHIQRNPKYWKNPSLFNPERFSEKNIGNIVPGSFIPFSSGPRNCIGQYVVMLSLKITIANVVRRFRMVSKHTSVDDIVPESCITMKIQNHLDCRFIER